jgi:hypothetical protein
MMNRRDFLKTSAGALAVGGAVVTEQHPLNTLIAPARADERDDYGFWKKGRWRNWSHNVEMKPKHIIRPTRLEELQEAVLKSKSLRAVGSGHSISSIAYTEETLVNTEALAGIVSIDKARGIVRVRGGMKLRDFNEAIAQLGFCLPSTGDTTYQSLAGLLSTSTHGTGMKWGSCSDTHSLVGMQIVNPQGELITLSAEREADLPLLRAARVSLGSFGMTYTVDLKVVPLHNLEHKGQEASVSEAFDPRNWNDNDHYEFAYFPYADRCYQFFRNMTDKPITATRMGTWWHETFMENDMAKILLGVSSSFPSISPSIMKAFVKAFPEEHLIDRADKVMTIRRKTPTHLMEVALPIENGPKALEAYKQLLVKYENLGKHEGRWYANLPLQIRFVRADEGTLISMGEGRATCWFGLGSYIKHKGFEPFFREMEQILISLGGRPHWGKMYFTNSTHSYPKFGEWEAQRAAFDPKGKFRSRYLERLHGLKTAPKGSFF